MAQTLVFVLATSSTALIPNKVTHDLKQIKCSVNFFAVYCAILVINIFVAFVVITTFNSIFATNSPVAHAPNTILFIVNVMTKTKITTSVTTVAFVAILIST